MENSFKDLNNLFDYAHPLKVVVIGAGGTGSQLLTHLARVHASSLMVGQCGLQVVLIDDDVISPANKGRQMFSDADIGMPKAQVLIERINRFYNTMWDYDCTKFVNKSPLHTDIVIGCVDNVKARKTIQSCYNVTGNRVIWIDAGNGKTTGQIVVGSRSLKLPTIMELCPTLDKFEKDNDTPSCSLLEALEKQDLFINTFMATVIGQIMWNIVFNKRLTTAQAYVNLENSVMINKITPEKYYEISNRNAKGRKVESAKNKKRSKRTEQPAAG